MDVEADESIAALLFELKAATGVRFRDHGLMFEGEATLSFVPQGRGGMSDDSESEEHLQKQQSVVHGPPTDAAFGDASLLRRCLHRIHRFSPGVEGRALLHDGDRCTSLGHMSLINDHHVVPSTVTLSSLHAACRAGRVDAMESIVCDYGVDVNSRAVCGWTALHTAMLHGETGVVRHLLSLGAEDVATDDGVRASSLRPALWGRVTGYETAVAVDTWTPRGSARGAVKQLVEMLRDGDASTQALCHRVCAAVETLGPSVLEEKVVRWTVLTIAAMTGRYSLCRVLIELGADVGQPRGDDATPLCVACEEGNVECARLFLEHGAQVDTAREDCATPVCVTCAKCHLHCARLLLDRGAGVDQADEDGWTPLYVACATGRPSLTSLLVDRNADVNKAKGNGATPLHTACRRNHRYVALILLMHGADPMRTNEAGDTAASYALKDRPDHELAEAVELATRDRAAAIERLRRMNGEGPQ